MANRRLVTQTVTIEPVRAKPVARISPSSQTKVIGSAIQLDARGSTISDGSALEYGWSFVSTPLGSTVTELRDVEADGSVVTFTPDMTGPYEVQLVVGTAYRDSDAVTATVSVQAVLVSALVRTEPNADFFFRVLSDFWQRVEDRGALSVLWSGYTQVVACDLLRLFQVDYAKSIRDIQTLFQRRWLNYSPRIELQPDLHWGVFGNHQSGDTAFTESAFTVATGIIISDREIVLTSGTPVATAVGTGLWVYTGANAAETAYTINRLNSDGSGYIVSVATLFPAAAGDILASGSDLVTSISSSVVTSPTDVPDFSATVSVGDVLLIRSGADRGYHDVIAVDGNTLTLSGELATTRAGLSFTVFRSVRITAERTVSPLTDTVFIPSADADLSVFTSSTLTGSAIIQSPYEVLLPTRHVLDAMLGRPITITSGSDAGKSFTVSSMNASKTGYIVGSKFSAPYPATVAYEIGALFDISDRVLVVEDQAYAIVSAVLDEDQPSVEDGGRGPLWVVTVEDPVVPTGRENLTWRIAGSIVSEELTDTAEFDLEGVGILPGDKLVLRVTRTDVGRSAEIPCQVFGATGNKLSFDIGTNAPAAGENGFLSDEEIIALVDDIGIPRAYADPVSGALLVTLLAEVVRQILASGSFQAANYNLPVQASSDIDLGGYLTVRLSSAYLVRNSRVRVDDSLSSIPALFEYIVEPSVGEDDDGNIVLVSRDATESILSRAPSTLIENRDYTLSEEGGLSGSSAITVAGSGTFTLLHADLIDRDVRVGDLLALNSGQDQAEYVILEVTSVDTVRAMTMDGAVPGSSAELLTWAITRRVTGNFLRFVDGLFTAASPAPDRMWAETSFFDNSDYIEDNFGLMVGLTKDQFDSYGSSQTSYKGAISGLMYAWARGPTVENTTIGAHILAGLPVTEAPGIITAVDDDYDDTRGRLLIEDTNALGSGIGVVRVYYYHHSSDAVLDAFEGLAENAETGSAFKVGDTVPPFTVLSKGALVTDYIETPDWWTVGGVAVNSGAELQKYHTWQLTLDADAVDSRDMPLITQFAGAIRPIYTKASCVLVKYIMDSLQTDDTLSLVGTLYQFDDAAFSLQSTRMSDDYADSLPLRRFGFGSFSTRTLFSGHDLVTTAGVATVTSARAGFFEIPSNPPNDYFPDHPMVDADNADTVLADDALPQMLVRAGDILYIPFGVNNGRFLILSVEGDDTLVIDRLRDAEGEDYPPRSMAPAQIQAAADQVFYIERENTNPLVTGVVNGVSGETELVFTDGNLLWDGVTVGDEVVFVAGPHHGRHRIVAVTRDTVTLRTPLVADETDVEVTIEREVLRQNPLIRHGGAVPSTAMPFVTIPSGYLRTNGIRTGDVFTFLSGLYAGQEHRIIDTQGDVRVWLDPWVVFPVAGPAADFTISRPHLSADSDDTDLSLEDIGLYDSLEFTVVYPLELLQSVANASITDSTLHSVTDLTPAAAAVKVEIMHPASLYNPAEVTGVFDIDSMSLHAAELSVEPGDTTLPHRADFYGEVADFDVLGDGATSLSYNLTDLGVVPGDIFRYEGGDFVIRGVTGSIMLFTSDTGAASTYTGRVVRRSFA